MYTLHIGDKAYSSWSLRGWLLLRAFGLPFEERLHRMYDPAFAAYAAAHPARRSVPALSWTENGRAVDVWDTLAMAETLAERHPDAGLWPIAADARAAARVAAAQMHAGFGALRAEFPMNLHRCSPLAPSDAVRGDLKRLSALWAWARAGWGGTGPWLFGADFTAADAFFAPVAFRIHGYELPVDDADRAYVDALRQHPAVAEWTAAALDDPRRIALYDRP
jgi:glutathione S-transferase